MNEFTQPKGALDAIGEALRLLLKGQITKEQYAEVCKPVTPVVVRAAPSVSEDAPSAAGDTRDPRAVGTELAESPREDRQDCGYVSPEDFISAFTTHPDQATGQSQKACIATLLSDGRLHDTKEIMNLAYKVDGERGNCNIKARANELRNDGYMIDFAIKIKGSLHGYICDGKQSTPYMAKKKTKEERDRIIAEWKSRQGYSSV